MGSAITSPPSATPSSCCVSTCWTRNATAGSCASTWQAGQRARALRVYHECVTTLERELGVRPSPETVEVYERLLAEHSQHQAVPPVVGVPLVGRDAEWRQLVACWEASGEGRAQLVMVTGEAGIGKSRLVEDFRAWCARGGHPTTTSRAYEAEGNLSYGPIVDALRSPAVRPRAGDVGAGVAGRDRSALA